MPFDNPTPIKTDTPLSRHLQRGLKLLSPDGKGECWTKGHFAIASGGCRPLHYCSIGAVRYATANPALRRQMVVALYRAMPPVYQIDGPHSYQISENRVIFYNDGAMSWKTVEQMWLTAIDNSME